MSSEETLDTIEGRDSFNTREAWLSQRCRANDEVFTEMAYPVPKGRSTEFSQDSLAVFSSFHSMVQRIVPYLPPGHM